MPLSAPKPCTYPGCSTLVRGASYCPTHAATQHRRYLAKARERYVPAAQRKGLPTYHSVLWRRIRAEWLSSHPLCVSCAQKGCIQAATEVDHIIPHKGDWALFLDRGNLRGLCIHCHSSATVRYDGGFGRERREKPKNLP